MSEYTLVERVFLPSGHISDVDFGRCGAVEDSVSAARVSG